MFLADIAQFLRALSVRTKLKFQWRQLIPMSARSMARSSKMRQRAERGAHPPQDLPLAGAGAASDTPGSPLSTARPTATHGALARTRQTLPSPRASEAPGLVVMARSPALDKPFLG
jgi:hypothetical protein